MTVLHGENETIGEFIGGVLAVETEEQAREFYARALSHLRTCYQAGDWKNDHTPEEVLKSNIGWCFGEGMASERREMWVGVCGASHPVFGTMSPTSEEALAAGIAMGEALKEQR